MEISNKIPAGVHPPMYQSHCQLLSKVPQKKLVETWLDVCRQAPGGVITTAFLESYLDKHNLRSKSGRVSIQAAEPAEDPEPKQEHIAIDQGSSTHSMNIDTSLNSSYQQQTSSSNLANTPHNNNTLPFNEFLIFELSKEVVLGNQFDMVLQSVEDFQAAENKMWAGRIWSNLASVRPLTTSEIYSVPPTLGDSSVFEGGLEHLLRIIFTKFAAQEFAEGIFLLRAEFGADWFSPILRHPYCILRHTNPPAPIEIPITSANLSQASPLPSESTTTSKRSKRASFTASEFDGMKNRTAAAPMTASVQPPFESFVLFYLGPNLKEFCSVFRRVALVPGVNSWSAFVGTSAPSSSGATGGLSPVDGGNGSSSASC
ncbi:hypothetical protein BDR26DRAFT_876123 [Obelidium mucronatum]|nr:hypothetical protein BDR26DRAFT_876123 [Obelidium mucronatum]